MSFHSELGTYPLFWLAVVIALAICDGTALRQEVTERPRVGLSVWDTGNSSSEQLRPEAVDRKQGWKAITGRELANAFEGDAVISNGRLLAVARRQGSGIELYSLGATNSLSAVLIQIERISNLIPSSPVGIRTN
jgi:hypothetical protein